MWMPAEYNDKLGRSEVLELSFQLLYVCVKFIYLFIV